MSFSERSYSGELFRPRPEVIAAEDDSLLIVATPWGPRNSARKVAQFIQDFFLSARDDQEATSPFARLTCLSPLANQLRLTVKMANDMLYHEENKSEYLAACELTLIAKTPNEIAMVQIGFPFLMLDRPTSSLIPLGNQSDLATELSLAREPLPPLPSRLLGLDPTSDFAVHSMKPVRGDRIVLVSRSSLPAELYALPFGRRALDDIAKTLALTDARTPFWLGEFNIK
jgi:hypothetical protein